LLGYALFAPVGSWIASRNLAFPYLVSAFFMFGSGLLAAAMVEPPRVMDDESGSYVGEMARSARLILRNRTVLWLTLFSALMFIATRIGFWTFQPFMEQAGLSVALFGLAFAAYSVFGAWVSTQADRVGRALRPTRTLILLPACVIVAFLGMSRWISVAGISFIFLQEISMGLYDPVLLSYTNRHVPSSIRATTLSFQSLAGNLAFAALSPFLGLFVDGLGLAWALRCFALIVAVLAAVLLLRKPTTGLVEAPEAT
jgi:MFS family permease